MRYRHRQVLDVWRRVIRVEYCQAHTSIRDRNRQYRKRGRLGWNAEAAENILHIEVLAAVESGEGASHSAARRVLDDPTDSLGLGDQITQLITAPQGGPVFS